MVPDTLRFPSEGCPAQKQCLRVRSPPELGLAGGADAATVARLQATVARLKASRDKLLAEVDAQSVEIERLSHEAAALAAVRWVLM